MAITGTCLCESVKYAIEGKLRDAGNCHCSMCRRQHGAAYATYATIESDEFRWVSGEELVTHYASSGNASWIFCSRCGSTLGAAEDGRVEAVTLGTIDGDPGIRPRSHIFVGSKAPWHEIDDELPQFEEWPPGEAWS